MHVLLVNVFNLFSIITYYALPVQVAARPRAWVCGHSLAGIPGSNPAGDMDVCLLCVLRVFR
jgi:hypothetical protein